MAFVRCLELSRLYYHSVVRPMLDARFPGVRHSAALIGPGSEVLGFDTERSTDHDWGPRVLLFLEDQSEESRHGEILLDLPSTFAGWPTGLSQVTDLRTWTGTRLGFDPRQGVSLLDWLSTPTQRLAEITAGAVFHDGLGKDGLGTIREALAWYPDDVWRYLLACQWRRIAQEEAFVGRCHEIGDITGASVVTARLTRDLMRLSMLLDRRYPLYSKWLGTAAASTTGTSTTGTSTTTAADSTTDPANDLLENCVRLAERQNRSGLAEPVDPSPRPYYTRPYHVLGADRFVDALRAAITDPHVATLPLSGAIDQFADNTDLLNDPTTCRAVMTAVLAPNRPGTTPDTHT